MIPSVVARQTRETILAYLRTTFALADAQFEKAFFDFLDSEAGLFKGPYLDVRLPFRRAEEGDRIPLEIRPSFRPWQHQLKAFQRLYSKDRHQPQHTLVTTGTGSGKTECFLYPVLDHCWRQRGEPGVKAIILYPMNALASDQARRLAETLWDDERLQGEVSAGLYVGGNGDHGAADREHLIDKREILRDSPPDILLTNYRMLDFLLLRPEDRRLWERNGPDTLRYLVLDELHTYDGAQGSDVACLIRRLKDRLQIAPGSLCCVGTSATVGGKERDRTVKALTEFASQIFGEHFFDDSVITEERLTPDEALGPVVDIDRLPNRGSDGLEPAEHGDVQGWLKRQAELWLGDGGGALDPPGIGQHLERHDFLRQLLKVLKGEPKSWQEVDRGLLARVPDWENYRPEERELLLESFVGLLSVARREEMTPEGEKRIEPFLVVQLQLWVRELRQLVRRVKDPAGAQPFEFAWASELEMTSPEVGKWLPIAYCRDCGGAGLASFQREGEAALKTELSQIGRAWLRRYKSARYVAFGHDSGEEDEIPTYLYSDDLTIDLASERTNRHGDNELGIPVRIGHDLSEQTPPRFLAKCPDCGSDRSLRMLGSRAPSLLSVSISHVFLSEYNDDKKLLAFTDSVQDASHRAGFFGARTYRFNLRTAIQGLLEARDEDIPLLDMGEQMVEFWGEQIERPKLIATLMPADLRDLPTYLSFLERRGGGSHKKLMGELLQRLWWEVTMEYGLTAKVGRTLERTLCSTARFDQRKLEKATEHLLLELEEENTLDLSADELSEETVQHFLAGFLARARTRGGIDHPLLKGYIDNDGAWFLLTKRRQPLMSPFSRESVFPRFLVDRSSAGRKSDPVFDSVVSPSSSWTWHRDWASRVFGIDRKHDGINDLYQSALRGLESAGLLVHHEKGRKSAWGIDPESLAITKDVGQVVCSECRRHVELPRDLVESWEGRQCLQYRCLGKLEKSDDGADSYYARIYRAGRLERVFSDEHTGLLTREAREKLEEEFKTGDAPDATNLIVCTPTLEMGIDIGDLSAAMLCSVPPSVASYQQRIGRAGRKTGNAVLMVMANHKPHDLYFQAEPKEMLSGPILPPGCFLDAPEMLKRQLVAHAMDAWAREELDVKQIPHKTTHLLSKSGSAVFPGTFLEFYKTRDEGLTESFLQLFQEDLSEGNQEILSSFGTGGDVPASILSAFERVRLEREDLRALQKKALQRIQEIDKDPESFDDPEAEKREAEITHKLVGRLIVELGQKYPLNVLTDDGVLPNYAFPEPGVRLESMISDEADDGQRHYRAYEFIRPASSAIRELAPFNTFYADGRRVRITEIDLGTKAQPLTESWRLCRECSHMKRETAGDEAESICPRCGDLGWPDSGQLRTMVHFRRSRSLAARLESATVDDQDDRQSEHYTTQNLIDVDPENCFGAKLIEDLPFGYELLKNLKLREINFGKALGEDLKVAGRSVSSEGFPVCLDCGKVRVAGSDVDHAPYCRAKKLGKKESIEPLFLYREIQSEAIRILLPVSEVDLDRKRASFKAALNLGFRRHFQGDPGHLQVRDQREPSPGGVGHRQFLVVFDAVPGGTGYLTELWREQHFMDILAESLRALETCVCQQDSGKDGCYRCLFAYQQQRDLKLISSREAQAMLRSILSGRDKLKNVKTLSEVSIDSLVESELERKFLAALAARAEDDRDLSWEETLKGGEERWQLRIGRLAWEIRAQVDLGHKEGVAMASRPDFVIRLVQGGRKSKPVAVFCDGLAYHVCPDKLEGRIADDLIKRQAILDSEKFHVWTVTWKDVEDFEQRSAGPSLFANLDQGQLGKVAEAVGVELKREIGRQGNMEMLWRYLSQPDSGSWQRLAGAHLLTWVMSPPFMNVDDADKVEQDLQLNPERFIAEPYETARSPRDLAVISRLYWKDGFAALGRGATADLAAGKWDKARLVLRLFDDRAGREDPGFELGWRIFFQAWNLLQFHGRVIAQSSELIGEGYKPVGRESVISEVAETAGANEYEASVDPELAEILDYSTESSRPVIEAIVEAGLPLPILDYELPTVGGGCGPEPELAWPDLQIALLMGGQVEDRSTFERAGWTVVVEPTEPQAIVDFVRTRLEET